MRLSKFHTPGSPFALTMLIATVATGKGLLKRAFLPLQRKMGLHIFPCFLLFSQGFLTQRNGLLQPLAAAALRPYSRHIPNS